MKPLFQDRYDVRGFTGLTFQDRSGLECSLQKSSAACYDAIWLGISNVNPQIMASDAIRLGLDTQGQQNGWVSYAIPKEVLLSSRMHLTQNQVKQILPVLQYFAEHGELPDFETAQKLSADVEPVEEMDLSFLTQNDQS